MSFLRAPILFKGLFKGCRVPIFLKKAFLTFLKAFFLKVPILFKGLFKDSYPFLRPSFKDFLSFSQGTGSRHWDWGKSPMARVMHVVLAMECREKGARDKAERIIADKKHLFADATYENDYHCFPWFFPWYHCFFHVFFHDNRNSLRILWSRLNKKDRNLLERGEGRRGDDS